MHLSEAVIVSTARTPIGRARKGSLVDARPDDLVAFAIDAALKKVPELDRSEIVDVMVGCGFPQEKQGMNLARRAALLAGLPETVGGTTVNRFCASTLEKLSSLDPAFKPDGRVTAGNSCPLNDGAAAVVVMSDSRAKELGLKPRARIIASAVSGVAPEIMGVGPIGAVRRVLDQAGMTIDDVDVMELNEAFAAQVLPVCRELGVDPFGEKLNPHGGAIALGHPYGMTGARIMATLLNDLDTDDQEIGLET